MYETLTSRRGLAAINAVLAAALVCALAALAWQLSPKGMVVRGGEVAVGIRPLLAIGGSGRGQYPEIMRPAGAAFTPGGMIVVADPGNHRIVLFRSNGRYETEFGGFGTSRPARGFEASWEPGRFNVPLGVDVDDAGHIYVADSENAQIQMFGADTTFIARFPDPEREAEGEAAADSASDIAVRDVAVGGGRVFGADAHRIVAYTVEGDFLGLLGPKGEDAFEFDDITGITAADGRVFIVDSGTRRVHAVTADGERLWTIGSTQEDGAQDGVAPLMRYEFADPSDVALLKDGSLAVLDSGDGSVVLFTAEGRFLSRYGQHGSAPGEMLGATHIDALGSKLLISDTGNDRVQVVEIAR
jgi:DNA-binding beta-propeller fold protein YncE